MGEAPLTKAELSSNRRIEIAWPITNNTVVPEEVIVEENPNLRAVFDHDNWPGETPLWFYILKEAEIRGRGETLGPVGGRIVAEVLVGLLQRDLNSVSVLGSQMETRDTDCASLRQVHHGRSSQVHRCLVLTNRTNACEKGRC